MGIVHSFLLNQETDGDISSGPYGSITITDGSVSGTVDFSLSLTGILQNADIHSLGFVANYQGPLSVAPDTVGPAYSVDVGGKVQGLGNVTWDYIVNFGNGNPVYSSLSFSLVGDPGFDSHDIFSAQPQSVRGWESNVAVHAQSTDTPAGSETLISVTGTDPNINSAPEPASFVGFAALLSIMICRRFCRPNIFSNEG